MKVYQVRRRVRVDCITVVLCSGWHPFQASQNGIQPEAGCHEMEWDFGGSQHRHWLNWDCSEANYWRLRRFGSKSQAPWRSFSRAGLIQKRVWSAYCLLLSASWGQLVLGMRHDLFRHNRLATNTQLPLLNARGNCNLTRQVASTAHRLLSLLAEGLGSGFQPYCKSIIGAMLLKLKDKKCVSVIGTCLDKVYGNPYSLDQV